MGVEIYDLSTRYFPSMEFKCAFGIRIYDGERESERTV